MRNIDNHGISGGQIQHCSAEHLLKGDTNPNSLKSSPRYSQIFFWNRHLPQAIPKCMHELISERANQQPEALAVQSWDGTLTYAHVELYSTRLALDLVQRGLRGKVVPLCFEKSKWAVVALLGVMKSGAAFSLTDPSQPEARLRTIVEQTAATLIITSVAQRDLGAKMAEEVLVVAEEYFETERQGTLGPVNPESSMYIIFTSGSTGKPKGVMLSHTNFTSGAVPRADAVGYKPTSRVFDFPSYAFDVSIDCMLCTLSVGGCTCIPSEGRRMNDLSGAIRDSNSNMVHMTPSVARVLDADIIPSLDVLDLGGEAVGASDAAEWSKSTHVIIAYGPSECTVGCTINNTVLQSTGIGKGVGAAMWIVDPDNHDILLPEGEVGELLVEGPVVGLGYLGDPERTKEVFIQDPRWLSEVGRRGTIYKTGDLVRYESDGSGGIEFVGRKDQQIKLRGQRVELAEVEFNLAACLPTGVRVAAEVVNRNLVAFISPADNAHLPATLKIIDTELAKRVPRYMIPAAYITLDALPSLVSGKIDRKTLRAMDINTASANKQEVAKTDLEKTLQASWVKVLGDVEIYKSSNFFSAGGDSLRAMKLVATVREAGYALTVADIFTHPTLQDMALTLAPAEEAQSIVEPFSLIEWDIQEAKTKTAKLCDVPVTDIGDIYPCTPLQEALMALSAKFSEAYIAQRVVELESPEAAQRLLSAFQTTEGSCSILRTRIVQVSDRGLFQVVIRTRPSVHMGDNLQSSLVADRELGMELGDSLVRYAVIDNKFIIAMHHALYDGWSMPLVVERVNKAFAGESVIRPAEFKHFIKYLSSIPRKQSEIYWREQLSGANGVQFPAIQYEGYITTSDSLLEEHIPVKQPVQSTMANVIRGAWALVASQYIPSGDVVFGETLTGGNASVLGAGEIEGPMITTIPFRVSLDLDATVSEYLDSIKEQTIKQIAHEHFGLQHIRRLSPDALQASELRTGLVLHPRTEVPNSGPASLLVPAGDEEAAREALKLNTYALVLVCSMDEEDILVMASFDSDTVESSTMQNVLKQFHRVVKQLAEQPDLFLKDIDTVSGETLTAAIFEKDGKLARYHNGELQFLSNKPPRASEPAKKASASKQRQLRTLWSRVLRIPESTITSESNFFFLGGDSISAMKLASEARNVGLKISVGQMFQHRLLGDMASILEQATPSSTHVPFSSLDADVPDFLEEIQSKISFKGDVVDAYPLRPLQRIAVRGTFEQPRFSTRYDIISLANPDICLLQKACQSLIRHHEILRTIFTPTLAVVLSDLIVPFEQHTTTTITPIDEFVKTVCDEDISQPIPLGSSFVKFILVTSATESRLIFRISHAQYDEMCLPNILSSLSAFYASTTPQPSVTFSSYVSHILNTKSLSIPYWKTLLASSSSLTLLRPSTPVTRTHHFAIKAPVDISLRPSDITIGSIPTAAWALTLARHKSTPDILFGEVVSGRSVDFPADNVVGPSWQYIPFRVALQPSWTSLDLLRFVQDQHMASAAHEGLSLGEIAEHIDGWEKLAPFPRSNGTEWWFDTVVHQAVKPTTDLDVSEKIEAYYPHQEPLQEWKIQAFIAEDGISMTLEIVTFESWKEVAKELLNKLIGSVEFLVNTHDTKLLQAELK